MQQAQARTGEQREPAAAPPNQVAQAMERLGHAGRVIADIRIGANCLLEALFVSSSHAHQSDKFLHLILKEDAYMRQLLQDLRAVDAVVVAYAWKRQLAGQAGSSAVDRSRLALKAFTDPKWRFFPYLDDGLNDQTVGGSIEPDAVAFFSPDEGGSYVHARGFSVYHVFRHISEHAAMALQYFLGVNTDKSLYFLLYWICGYQTLFTEVCSKCGRLLSMDKQRALLLPPVNRPYQHFSVTKISSMQALPSTKDKNLDVSHAYHIDCFIEES